MTDNLPMRPSPYDPVPHADELPAWARMLPAAARLADLIARTEFVPKAMQGRPAAVAAAVLTGDELGLGPMTSLSRLHVIEGRVALSAEAMRALALAAGHEVWVDELTTTRATIAGRRRGSDVVQRITWTMDDAKRAGLAGRGPWRAYPRQMLAARATAELCRLAFPDVLSGIAALEELDTPDSGEAPALPPAPDTAQTRRRPARRATTPAAGPTSPVPAPPAPELPDTPTEQPTPDTGEQDGEGWDDPGEPIPTDQRPQLVEDAPSPAALRALHATYRDAGITERAARLAHATDTLGRPVHTSGDLTRAEVTRLMDRLTHPDPEDPPEQDDGTPTEDPPDPLSEDPR